MIVKIKDLSKSEASVVINKCLLIGKLRNIRVGEFKRSPTVIFPTKGFKDFEALFGRIRRNQ